jgi:hypothetical protein
MRHLEVSKKGFERSTICERPGARNLIYLKGNAVITIDSSEEENMPKGKRLKLS